MANLSPGMHGLLPIHQNREIIIFITNYVNIIIITAVIIMVIIIFINKKFNYCLNDNEYRILSK